MFPPRMRRLRSRFPVCRSVFPQTPEFVFLLLTKAGKRLYNPFNVAVTGRSTQAADAQRGSGRCELP